MSIKASTSTKIKLGTLKLELTFVGIEKKLEKDSLILEPKALNGEISLEDSVVISLGNMEIEGLKFSDIKGSAGFKTGIEPAWKKILWDLVKDKAKDALEKIAQEMAITIGGDVIIAGSFIVAGVATIGGACYELAKAFGMKDLAQSWSTNVASAKAGFMAGMTDAGGPGDQFGKMGYEQGQKNYKALFDKTKKENPNATDDAIKAAIVAGAGKAWGEVQNEVESKIRTGMWDGYLGKGTWLLTAKDAGIAFQVCFPVGDPRFNPPQGEYKKEWQKYLDKYPTQSKL
jgi:hypothetical protein